MIPLKNAFWTRRPYHSFPFANAFLLFFTFITVFVIPVFPGNNLNLLYSFSLSFVFIFAVLAIKKNTKSLIRVIIFLSITIWVSFFSEIVLLKQLFKIINFLFFIFLVLGLIKQVSSIATVTAKVIVDSISGYLLLGFAFSLIVAIVASTVPGAYNANFFENQKIDTLEPLHNNIYYTFMTFATTGYGDIVPTHPISKSLAVLISVSGQLYIAVIISMLVGKYASFTKKEK
ncbi:ion channel [Flavobacterium nackdongense]|uniref:Two pore domain potassium channel family protein n=1 Tax=Flavobacterium nackdongense TaxID=2547394 RepID=A0A4P6Y605_9FLAO|nr:ion channel [Flavobacterium nackdongense]QBN17679.1 two pore domain potassium channel family protein [Flavobacterium nackdongense]